LGFLQSYLPSTLFENLSFSAGYNAPSGGGSVKRTPLLFRILLGIFREKPNPPLRNGRHLANSPYRNGRHFSRRPLFSILLAPFFNPTYPAHFLRICHFQSVFYGFFVSPVPEKVIGSAKSLKKEQEKAGKKDKNNVGGGL